MTALVTFQVEIFAYKTYEQLMKCNVLLYTKVHNSIYKYSI